MPRINTLKIRFADKLHWFLSGEQGLVDDNEFELPPIGSRSLRRGTIDFLQQRLFEYRANERDESERVKQLLELIGEHLFELAFPARATSRAALEKQLEMLHDKSIDLLRIELEFPGPQQEWLSGLPWEYLRTPFDFNFSPPGVFLALMPTEIVLVRFLKMSEGAATNRLKLEGPPPWDTLVVCCSPNDPELALVDSGYIRNVIATQKTGPRREPAFKLIDDLPISMSPGLMDPNRQRVTMDVVQTAIRTKHPNIIHFIGHGRRLNGKGQLAFEGVDGKPDWIDEDRFAELAAKSNSLKLVILQACESALPNPHLAMSGVARRVADMNVPAVVAMQDKVQPQVANNFAEGFYQALADCKSVDLAVKAGRDMVSQRGTGEQTGFGLPVLYLRAYGGMSPVTIGASGPVGTGGTVKQRPMKCPRCKVGGLPQSAKFCNNCGLNFECEVCGCRLANPMARLCEMCKSPIRQEPASVEISPGLVRAAPSTVARGVNVVSVRGREVVERPPVEAPIRLETKLGP